MDSNSLREALLRLARNHRWTWVASTRRLLFGLPTMAPGAHPAGAVLDLNDQQIDGLLADGGFVSAVAEEIASLDADMAGAVPPRIAYCSPEFGLTARSAQYAGGLGVLAGDHLKAASEAGVAIGGVGLYYELGVFRQHIDNRWQTESFESRPPERVGAVDTGNVVKIPFPGRVVAARIWQVDMGRIPLLLLDTNLEANSPEDRAITDRLYVGSREHRLAQEMLLGVGGALATEALGWPVAAHHLNEGHAGLLILELLSRVIENGDLESAVRTVRPGLLFTTHTPVPAGIDRFERYVMEPYLQLWAEKLGVRLDDLWNLGQDPQDHYRFNMAAWCLRVCAASNGVSRLHGEVSRGLFSGVGIGDRIGYVTNGVHARTWTADHTQSLFDERLGAGWANGEEQAWGRASEIDDEALVETRQRSSRLLADLIADKSGKAIDPDVLIFGFARRFAPYKRATLLLEQRDRLDELFGDTAHPIHLVFSGKAHPSDDPGKELLSRIVHLSESRPDRVTFIADYDMEIAAAMVRGCDIWINTPIRSHEASGTSGEKAALNGCLNCSILDGWWAEMHDGSNGWSIPTSSSDDPVERDAEEAASLLSLIGMIAAEYHDDHHSFLPRIRRAWVTLGPKVTAARMLRDYQSRYYEPMLGSTDSMKGATSVS